MLGSTKLRVLVATNDRRVAAVFRDQLVDLGHDPVVVSSAEEALRALATDRPDAIVLDLSLPGLTGLEVLQLPPVRARAIPVIVVSGRATDGAARDCLRLGALDVIAKPISATQLGETLGFLELHVLNAQLATQVGSLDRRRSARVPSAFAVRLTGHTGAEPQAIARRDVGGPARDDNDRDRSRADRRQLQDLKPRETGQAQVQSPRRPAVPHSAVGAGAARSRRAGVQLREPHAGRIPADQRGRSGALRPILGREDLRALSRPPRAGGSLPGGRFPLGALGDQRPALDRQRPRGARVVRRHHQD